MLNNIDENLPDEMKQLFGKFNNKKKKKKEEQKTKEKYNIFKELLSFFPKK